MTRGKKRPNASASKRLPPSDSLALVPVDCEQALEEQRLLYQARLRELNRQTEVLNNFREEESPAFSNWVESEFADLLKASFDTGVILRQLEATIQNVENFAMCMGISERAAYHQLETARRQGKEEELWDEIRRRHKRPEPSNEAAFEDLLREMQEGIYRRERKEPATSAEQHLKSVYRQLVKMLHPDTRGDLSESDRQVWQAVQDTYTQGDVQGLERLLETLTEGRVRARDAATLPLGDLIDLRRDVEKRLRNLKIELRKVRANPAWKFRSILKISWRVMLMRNQITKELQADLFQMRRSKKHLEDKIAGWRRHPRSSSHQHAAREF